MVFGDILIGDTRRGIDNTKIHTSLNGMIEEDGMHSFTDIVVATEGETQIAHSATYVGSWQIFLYPSGSADEVQSISVVLFQPRSYREYVGVKDDVTRIHAHLLRQNVISALSYLDTPLIGSSLALFVEAHDYHGCTEALYILGVADKHALSFLQRDGIDHRLSLTTLEASKDDIPFRRVYHHRNACHVGFRCQ